jgi:glyoxylase I family protein
LQRTLQKLGARERTRARLDTASTMVPGVRTKPNHIPLAALVGFSQYGIARGAERGPFARPTTLLEPGTRMSDTHSIEGRERGTAFGFHGVRYQVADVARAVAFYTQQLGFELRHQQLPAFANVSLGPLALLLSGPGASGSRPMPDGRAQQPGGWNRIVLRVTDLPTRIEALRALGLRLRNEMEVGPGGRQIQLDDPDGNPIELFEPAQ